jgi:hypothetical protein
VRGQTKNKNGKVRSQSNFLLPALVCEAVDSLLIVVLANHSRHTRDHITPIVARRRSIIPVHVLKYRGRRLLLHSWCRIGSRQKSRRGRRHRWGCWAGGGHERQRNRLASVAILGEGLYQVLCRGQCKREGAFEWIPVGGRRRSLDPRRYSVALQNGVACFRIPLSEKSTNQSSP